MQETELVEATRKRRRISGVIEIRSDGTSRTGRTHKAEGSLGGEAVIVPSSSARSSSSTHFLDTKPARLHQHGGRCDATHAHVPSAYTDRDRRSGGTVALHTTGADSFILHCGPHIYAGFSGYTALRRYQTTISRALRVPMASYPQLTKAFCSCLQSPLKHDSTTRKR